MAAELRLHTHTICQIAYLVRSSVFRLEYASYQSLAVNSIIRSGKKKNRRAFALTLGMIPLTVRVGCVLFSQKKINAK